MVAEQVTVATPARHVEPVREKVKRKERRRAPLLPIQLGMRVSAEMFDWLLRIGEYENVEYTEMVRSWLRQQIADYRKDPFFMKWLEERGTE